MKDVRLAVFLVAALMQACASPGSGTESLRILSPAVAEAYRELDETMQANRPPLRFESGAVASSCAAYLEQRTQSPVDEGLKNRLALQEYLICDTVGLLAAAAGRRVAPETGAPYGERLRRHLDLRTFPSSLRQLADDHPVLAEMDAIAVRAQDRAAIAESDDWFFKLDVVALADVNGDGRLDWLVWLTDEAHNGTYRDYAVLVVTNATERGRLRAEAVRRRGLDTAPGNERRQD